MSSRLPISPSSRSAFSSIVASSASLSDSVQATSVCRRLLTLALIEASGVRRSWLTAASSAVRIRLPSASASAWAAWVRSRSRSSAAAACAAKPASSPGATGPGWPLTSSARSLRTPTRVTAAPAAALPLAAIRTQRPLTFSCSSARPPRVCTR